MKYFSVLILSFISIQAFACGSTAQQFLGYWRHTTLETKSSFLKEHSCTQPINYSPRNADPIIAKVVVDAINSGVSDTIIKKVLTEYNCVYSARTTEEFTQIMNYIGVHQYNEQSRLHLN